MKHLLSILCFALCFLPAVTFADPLLNITPPAKWEPVDTETNETRIAVYVDNSTENRIEIHSKEFAKKEHAKTFLTSFNANLTQNNFKENEKPTPRAFELSNGKKRTGQMATYTYELAEAPVQIKTFTFNVDTTAYIVTLYYSPQNKESKASAEKAFDEILKNMTNAK